MWSNRWIAPAGALLLLSSSTTPAAAAEPLPTPPTIRETGRLAEVDRPPVQIPAATDRGAPREQASPKVPERRSETAQQSEAAPSLAKVDSPALAKQIRTRFAALQECPTEVARHKRASLAAGSAGKLTLRWTISPGGRVSDTAVVANSQVNPFIMDCVKRQMSAWLFTPPDGGGTLRLERKLSFRAR